MSIKWLGMLYVQKENRIYYLKSYSLGYLLFCLLWLNEVKNEFKIMKIKRNKSLKRNGKRSNPKWYCTFFLLVVCRGLMWRIKVCITIFTLRLVRKPGQYGRIPQMWWQHDRFLKIGGLSALSGRCFYSNEGTVWNILWMV